MELISNYENALQAIYDHVGFKEDWVIAPIDDCVSCDDFNPIEKDPQLIVGKLSRGFEIIIKSAPFVEKGKAYLFVHPEDMEVLKQSY